MKYVIGVLIHLVGTTVIAIADSARYVATWAATIFARVLSVFGVSNRFASFVAVMSIASYQKLYNIDLAITNFVDRMLGRPTR